MFVLAPEYRKEKLPHLAGGASTWGRTELNGLRFFEKTTWSVLSETNDCTVLSTTVLLQVLIIKPVGTRRQQQMMQRVWPRAAALPRLLLQSEAAAVRTTAFADRAIAPAFLQCCAFSGRAAMRVARGSTTGTPAKRSPRHAQKHSRQRRIRSDGSNARLRVADMSVAKLVSTSTPSHEFVATCEQLRGPENEIRVLAGTDLQVWNFALQNRLMKKDVEGASALLDLLASFDRENANAQLWTDLLFTLMRQHSALSRTTDEPERVLNLLRENCADNTFMSDLVISLVNGCANVKMFAQAKFLVRYHLEHLRGAIEQADEGEAQDESISSIDSEQLTIPSCVLSNLISNMAGSKSRHKDVLAFVSELLANEAFQVQELGQPGFIAVFRCISETSENPSRLVDAFLTWFQQTALELQSDPTAFEKQEFHRAFGAVIQSCVATGQAHLALRCYDALQPYQKPEADDSVTAEAKHPRVQLDENIYVNLLKACVTRQETSVFKDIYRAMVRNGVARSPGFGSAIRFCNVRRDVGFLEEVLDDAFTTETQMHGAWMLAIEQYNDALGCFAATKSLDMANDLFTCLLNNPFVVPNHITMLQMVENHREAPFADVFHLMEVFLEWKLAPNLQVFTSLLATCARRRLVSDAVVLLDAMKAQGIEPDVKAYTAIAFVHASHSDLHSIVGILKDMQTSGIATDQVFFDYVTNALYGVDGIDICFALFREMREAGLRIPEGMYASLIQIGTKVGLIERTLHVAFQMECDGFAITSEQMLALIVRCESNTELTELIRTFFMLHQDETAQDGGSSSARFSEEVYEELIDVLTRFSKKDVAAKVRTLASKAGYSLSN